jgi:hypothetical protein
MGGVLIVVWCIALLGQVAIIKKYVPFTLDIFAIGLLFGFILFLFNPFDCMFRGIRGSILTILVKNCMSPFSVVRFSSFFTADVLTSLVKPIIDLAIVLCFV